MGAQVVRGLAVQGQVEAAVLVVRGDAEAHGAVEQRGEQPGDAEGEHRDDRGGRRLPPEQRDAAAEQQAAGSVGGHRRGEQTDEDGADDPADPVYAGHVERVVVAEPDA